MSSKLPDFSELAAKPPQRPIEALLSRPSTSDYKSALSATAGKVKQPQCKTQSKPPNLNLDTVPVAQEATVSPTSASWRPNFDRHQSWSMEDHKRAMQTPLMSPKLDRGKDEYGFSSKDEEDEGKKK